MRTGWSRYLRWAVILLIAIYLVVVLPLVLNSVVQSLSLVTPGLEPLAQAMQDGLNSQGWMSYVAMWYIFPALKYNLLFFLPGALLWVFQVERKGAVSE